MKLSAATALLIGCLVGLLGIWLITLSIFCCYLLIGFGLQSGSFSDIWGSFMLMAFAAMTPIGVHLCEWSARKIKLNLIQGQSGECHGQLGLTPVETAD